MLRIILSQFNCMSLRNAGDWIEESEKFASLYFDLVCEMCVRVSPQSHRISQTMADMR